MAFFPFGPFVSRIARARIEARAIEVSAKGAMHWKLRRSYSTNGVHVSANNPFFANREYLGARLAERCEDSEEPSHFTAFGRRSAIANHP